MKILMPKKWTSQKRFLVIVAVISTMASVDVYIVILLLR